MQTFDRVPKQPAPAQRPRDFEEAVRRLRQQYGDNLDRLVRLELAEMATGGNPKGGNPDPDYEGIRADYYPDWKDDDFRELLKRLGHPMQE